MATLTKEQIEAKQQRYHQVVEEAEKLREELEAAGVKPLEDADLESVAAGMAIRPHLVL